MRSAVANELFTTGSARQNSGYKLLILVRPARLERATSWLEAVNTFVDPAQLTNPGARFGAATWTQSWSQDYSPSTGVSPAQVAHLLTRICPLTRSRPVIWWLRSFILRSITPGRGKVIRRCQMVYGIDLSCRLLQRTLNFGHATPPGAGRRARDP